MSKRLLSAVLCALLLACLSGCGTAQVQPAFETGTYQAPLSDNLIAENANFRLDWNDGIYGVILTDKRTGQSWGSSPAEDGVERLDSFGMPVKRHEMVNSVLSVYYRNKTANTDNNNVYSYGGVVENGHIRCARIDNGVHVEYFFDSLEFMIPVDFVLYDDHLRISVNPKLIEENENIVTSVSIAPFLCSAPNDTAAARLFVPSGSGALIATDTVSLQGNTFSAPVYGEDLSQEKLYEPLTETPVRLPVFGVDSGSGGIFAVIDGAEESALIEAIAGGEAYGYTTVYPTFEVRGYTRHQTKIFTSSVRTYIIYADSMISQEMGVSYYPLSAGESDYSAMARTYRDYLKANGAPEQTDAAPALHIDLIGGAEVTRSFLGIPYSTVQPTTTLKQAADIVSDLADSLGGGFTVNLKGFGASGIDIGKVAGGFHINRNIGTRAQLKKLAALCRDRDVGLYMDFDIVNFSKSGGGFNTFFDGAVNVGRQKVTRCPYDKAIRIQEKQEVYSILSPAEFGRAADKLIGKTDGLELCGISLSTLSSLTTSDYTDTDSTRYYSGVGFAEAATDAIKKLRENGRFLADSANLYAALLADTVTGVPTASSGDLAFCGDVPFYQMVFRGSLPMSVESLNLSDDPDALLLKAVESGCGLSYTVIGGWDNALIDSNYACFYSGVYADIKEEILRNTERLSDYYRMTGAAAIVSHEILGDNLTVTRFDNGVSVYVNHGGAPAETPAGALAARDFLIWEGDS